MSIVMAQRRSPVNQHSLAAAASCALMTGSVFPWTPGDCFFCGGTFWSAFSVSSRARFSAAGLPSTGFEVSIATGSPSTGFEASAAGSTGFELSAAGSPSTGFEA